MKDYDIKKYTKRLRKVLDDDRFEHTLGAVSYTHLEAELLVEFGYPTQRFVLSTAAPDQPLP